MIRPLILDSATEVLVRRVREHAEKPENWFRPGRSKDWGKLQGSGLRPGDKPEYQVTIPMGYHCIFSWTVAETRDGNPVVVRDLAVSAPGATPNPIAVFELAELFGFTKRPEAGAPHPRWQVGFDECRNPCMTVAEKAPEEVS